MKFEIKIDKDTAFDYWTQSLSNWSGYFQTNEGVNLLRNKKLADIISPDIKNFLKNRGYNWLWRKYTKKLELAETEKWEEIKNKIRPIFNKIWEDHLANLIIWKTKLEEASKDPRVLDFLDKTYNFLDSEFNQKGVIKIYLLLSYGNSYIGGYSMASEIMDSIVLNISGLNTERVSMAVNTLCHEVFHLFYKDSNSNEILKKKFLLSEIWSDNENQSFLKESRFLIVESILTSLSYKKLSYLDYDKTNPLSVIEREDKKKLKSSKEYRAIYLADKLRPMTYEYLERKGKIDENYTNFLISNLDGLF